MTRVIYRGHEIEVEREKCLGGYKRLHYSIYRVSDGYCVEESSDDSAEKVRDMVEYMKKRLDAEIEEGTTFDG
jgi:hypothetical protein